MVCTVDGLTGHVVMLQLYVRYQRVLSHFGRPPVVQNCMLLLLLCHRATDVAGSLHHEKLPSAPSVRPAAFLLVTVMSMKLLNDSNGPLPTHISLFDSISKKEPSLLYFYTYRLR